MHGMVFLVDESLGRTCLGSLCRFFWVFVVLTAVSSSVYIVDRSWSEYSSSLIDLNYATLRYNCYCCQYFHFNLAYAADKAGGVSTLLMRNVVLLTILVADDPCC